MFGLMVFGWISFQRMGMSQMPDVNFPVVNVALRLDNAAPEVMELSVVDLIEDAVMGIEGLSNVSSSVSQGTANITCNFELNKDINVALQDVQNRINQSANRLPTALYPPVITKTNPEDQPLMWVMLTVDPEIPSYQQMMMARNTFKNQLSTLPGVGNVVLAGYVEPNLRIWLNAKKMKQFDLTSSDLWNAIPLEQIEQPAGRIEASDRETNLRVLGEANTELDFSNIRINSRAGGVNYAPVLLKQVARVEEGLGDLRAISRYNGKSAVGLGVVKQHGANAVEVGKVVRAQVESLQKSLLPGYHLEVKLDATRFIQDSVHQLNQALLGSALLTSVVCLLFLGSWSSTFNVLLAIPTSIVGAFIALYFFGFTLNTFTLLGLSLAIGIVVDDAIMMLENIVRHFDMGKTRRQAALEGSEEITFAAIATTLAIAAIFVPVIFLKGVVGQFFYQYGITVTVAVFLSLLEALTLTPMRCARFLQSSHGGGAGGGGLSGVNRWMERAMEQLTRAYARSLRTVLAHRLKLVGLALALFCGSMVLVGFLRKELIPPQDQSLFLLVVKTKVGTAIQATDEAFRQVEAELCKRPEVLDLYTTIGNYQNNNVVNAGVIYVILKPSTARTLTQQEVMQQTRTELRHRFPHLTLFTQDLSLTGLSASRGFPVEFTVEGPDWEHLKVYTDQLLEQLAATGFLEDLNRDYQDDMPEVHIVPDRLRAGARGVSVAALGQEVAYTIGGQIFNAATQYPKGGHRYSIRVRSEPEDHSSPESLKAVRVRNDRGTVGELVPLLQAASLVSTKGFQLISRVNRARAIPVFANVAEGQSQQAAIQQVVALAEKILPPGYQIRLSGGTAAFQETFSSLFFALILGLVVSYMVLASQFNSFLHPFTVLTALPFSLSGALIALALTHQSLSLYSLIGLVLLMGIVKKNSILLVDFTNQKREAGMTPEAALLEACPIRLRPILMTSLATIVGALPEAFNFGAGAEARIPMAVAMIGGVSLSTFLTLFVVPCVYSLLTVWERPESALESGEPSVVGGVVGVAGGSPV